MSLDEMQARCDAATPGPWKAGRSDMTSYGGMDGEPYKNVYGTDHYPHPNMPGEMVPVPVARGETERCHENAAFIAHARTDMPRLIAALRVAMSMIANQSKQLTGEALLEWYERKGYDGPPDFEGAYEVLVEQANHALARVTAILEGK